MKWSHCGASVYWSRGCHWIPCYELEMKKCEPWRNVPEHLFWHFSSITLFFIFQKDKTSLGCYLPRNVHCIFKAQWHWYSIQASHFSSNSDLFMFGKLILIFWTIVSILSCNMLQSVSSVFQQLSVWPNQLINVY